MQDAPCDPCMVHCCMHRCAICQEHREMKHHLSEDPNSDSTIVDPPQLQRMNVTEKPSSSSSREDEEGKENEEKEKGHEHKNEIQLQTVQV